MAKQEKLSARQIGRNIIMMIESVKFSKKTEDDGEVKSIKNKIELYNKKPSKVLLDQIKGLMTSTKIKEKEVKAQVKKGVKAQVKKETKKTTSKKVVKDEVKIEEPEKDLIEEVRKAHADGTVTDEQIKSLQDLLKKMEDKKKEEAPKEEAKKEEQKSSSGYSRRGEY